NATLDQVRSLELGAQGLYDRRAAAPPQALRLSRCCTDSMITRRRTAAVWACKARIKAPCTGVNAQPRRAITSWAIRSRSIRLEWSTRLPFHQLANEGTYFGKSEPDGSRLQKIPMLLPVLSKVPSPVLVWSPMKEPTLFEPLATGSPLITTFTSP